LLYIVSQESDIFSKSHITFYFYLPKLYLEILPCDFISIYCKHNLTIRLALLLLILRCMEWGFNVTTC